MEKKIDNNVGIALIILAIAVAFGAFGAHFLSERLEEKSLKAWQNAVLYQFIHGIGVVLCHSLAQRNTVGRRYFLYAQRLMLLGILFFSGSLYFLTTRTITGLAVSWLGPVTPVGGLMFISAWLMAAYAMLKPKNQL